MTKKQVFAIRALQEGSASEGQQKMAWDYIMNLCGVRDLEFRPGDASASAFASGKRFVGLQLVKPVTLPAALVEKLDD